MEKSSPAVKTKKTKKITEVGYRSAIEASVGTITDVSQRLKITTGAVCLYLDKHPEIKELLSKKRMDNVQLAEDVLFDHLKKGTDPKIRQDSAKYIAGRLGKKRGWTEKTETELTAQLDGTIDLSIISMCNEYNESEPNNPDSSKQSNKK